MSEWWLLIAAFWFWYLADCLKAGRKLRFVLSRSFGLGHASVSHSGVAVISASPLAWHVRTEDPPISFSPEGVSNVPVGSAGRPAPMPERVQVWRWDEIRQLAEKRGYIFLNGQAFCPVTSFTTLAGMRELIDGCKNRTPEARSAWLSARVACWFRPSHLRRQRNVLLGRTSNLVMFIGIGFFMALLASFYILFGSHLPVRAEQAVLIGRIFPLVGWYLLGLHLCIVVNGWWVHRHLLPKRGEARFSLLLSAALLPPQAYRLRSRIGTEFFQQAHPLAWLAIAAKKTTFVEYARQAVADLRWSLQPAYADETAAMLGQAVSLWMRSHLSGEIEHLLRDRDVRAEELVQAPEPDGSESCAYCPRCNSQFTTSAGRCPRGIKLLPLTKTKGAE